MSAKVLGLLGLAQAAGVLQSGRIAVEKAIARGKAHLVFLAADAGDDVARRMAQLCEAQGVPLRRVECKAELGRAIGRPERSVVAIVDTRFAKRLLAETAEGRRQPV
ncbi:MAG TPA: ribosomal L7Ae/L30e/S12e/Gadd45 family protein [Limnochordia bacterium]|nr:ribosomal L7Ae/L30e/S12e/Gadd45 family protein [Limnochordia bacterium]